MTATECLDWTSDRAITECILIGPDIATVIHFDRNPWATFQSQKDTIKNRFGILTA